MTIQERNRQISKTLADANHVAAHIRLLYRQSNCPHKHVDTPGSIFGETCTDCGKFLNNGM